MTSNLRQTLAFLIWCQYSNSYSTRWTKRGFLWREIVLTIGLNEFDFNCSSELMNNDLRVLDFDIQFMSQLAALIVVAGKQSRTWHFILLPDLRNFLKRIPGIWITILVSVNDLTFTFVSVGHLEEWKDYKCWLNRHQTRNSHCYGTLSKNAGTSKNWSTAVASLVVRYFLLSWFSCRCIAT